jgi:beta-phosphoglucomutase-like phosphatase (HAD superfamily)
MSLRNEGPIEAVIFDLDGVLVDSEGWWNEVRIEFARAHGRSWTHDDQLAVMGGNSREWAATMRDRLHLESLSAADIEAQIVDGVVGLYASRPSPVIGDAPAQVRRIAATRPVAIASSSHARVIGAALAALGIADVMRAIVSSDEVEHGKPAPDVYLAAAARLDADPRRCLVVEDSLNGVRAGIAAGMTVVLIPNATVPPAGNARELAHRVVGSLAELDPDALATTPSIG